MISGTWGIQPRYRFRGSKSPKGDGAAVCYIRGISGKWIVILPDGEDIPSLIGASKLEFKTTSDRRWRKDDE